MNTDQERERMREFLAQFPKEYLNYFGSELFAETIRVFSNAESLTEEQSSLLEANLLFYATLEIDEAELEEAVAQDCGLQMEDAAVFVTAILMSVPESIKDARMIMTVQLGRD